MPLALVRRKPTINHEPHAFIQNKRYPQQLRPIDGVVNPKAAFVYQTDAI
ncbi:MAG: hypothetical protein HY242_15705 [Afipia sp.]|nr:hypothetical protein [Afipia sp.]